jgi:hypothetical protein
MKNITRPLGIKQRERIQVFEVFGAGHGVKIRNKKHEIRNQK